MVGVVEVFVVVVDVCVIVGRMQDKLLSTRPSKKLQLFGTSTCWMKDEMYDIFSDVKD